MAPFGFLRKDRRKEKEDNKDKTTVKEENLAQSSRSASGSQGTHGSEVFGTVGEDQHKQPGMRHTHPQEAKIDDGVSVVTIPSALNLLHELESQRLQKLSLKLEPIRNSVSSSLGNIDSMAKDLERDNVKLEDLDRRFKSIVENSKRTIVATLRREASSDLPGIQSINDIRKFRERFESLVSRLSEVSGSHSRVLNIFMKKHAGKMKKEFETLGDLLKEAKSILSDFENEREPIVKCSSLLNTMSQKILSINSTESSMADTKQQISALEHRLATAKQELASLEASPEFIAAADRAREIEAAENEEGRLRQQIADRFLPFSKALAKYSYGVTKETHAMLQTMINEPWKIFESENIDDYRTLLQEVRNSIESNKIQLKDSEKSIHQLEETIAYLPDLYGRHVKLASKVQSMTDATYLRVSSKASDLRAEITQYEQEIHKSNEWLEQQRKQLDYKRGEIQGLLKTVEEMLESLLNKRYTVSVR